MPDEIGADASPEPEVEVVEAEAEATEVEVEESEAESPPADESNVEEKKDAFQGRIDKLTKSFRESERTAANLQEENDKLRKQVEDTPTVRETKSLADFEYDEDKYREYVFSEAESRAEDVALKTVKGFTETERKASVEDEFVKREKVFADTVDDYDAVVHVYDGSLKISPTMAAEIRESEIGPEVAYYLGKNPDVSAEISRLPDRSAVRRMISLESDIQSEKAKQSNKVSKAPPPPAKLGAAEPGLKVSTTDAKSDKMSDADWFKAEEKRQAKLRG